MVWPPPSSKPTAEPPCPVPLTLRVFFQEEPGLLILPQLGQAHLTTLPFLKATAVEHDLIVGINHQTHSLEGVMHDVPPGAGISGLSVL